MRRSLFRGTLHIYFNAIGNNTSPDEMILMEATSKAVSALSPSFINIKLLPQMNESAAKMSQLKSLLFTGKIFAKVHYNYFT